MLHHHRHGDRNRQLQVPITVTTQQRGPLQLGGQTTILPSPHILCSSIARQSRVGKKIHNDPQTPRPLTRFAVTMKPIDIVEEHLREGLSCAELTHEIEHHLSQVSTIVGLHWSVICNQLCTSLSVGVVCYAIPECSSFVHNSCIHSWNSYYFWWMCNMSC